MPDFTVTTGATPISVTVNSGVALEGANVYNIKTYGASGDGSTDDTAAIQSAIDACEAAGSGTIYAPPGSDYLISGSGMIIRNTSDAEQIVFSAYGARFFRNEDPDPGVTGASPILTIGSAGENCVHVEVRGGLYEFAWTGAAHTDGGDTFSKEQWLVDGSDCIRTINMRHSSVNDVVCRYGRTGVNLVATGTSAFRGTATLTTTGASTVFTVVTGDISSLGSGDSFLIHYATTDADDDTQFATMAADSSAVITDITGSAVTTDFDSTGMTAADMDTAYWVSSSGGRGSVYNTFSSNRIVNCYSGYGLESATNGAWVNENTFTGGSIAYGEDISNYSTNAADGRGIRMSPYTYHANVMNNNRFVDISIEGAYAKMVKECGDFITSDRCGLNAYIRLRCEGMVTPIFDFGSRLGAKDVGRKYEHRVLISRPNPAYDMATLFAEADAINSTNNIDVAASGCNIQTDDYNRFSGRTRSSGYSTASYAVVEVHLSDSATYPAFAVRDAGCNAETGVELFGQGALWLEPVASIAGAAVKEGTIYYDSDENALKVYTGSAWEQLATATDRDQRHSWGLPVSAANDVYFIGGFYAWGGSSNDFSTPATLGSADASYAAHVSVVLGALTVDELTLTVTGTTITDAGVRATGQTEDIVIPNATSANAYFETSKKWLDQPVISVASGTAKVCNYGFTKYWDNDNANFTVTGLEALWLGGTGSGIALNIELLHHRSTGWTYGAGGTPTVPTALVDMSAIHSTDVETYTGQEGAFKVTPLATAVAGGSSEGVLVRVTTGGNNQLGSGQLTLSYKHV